MDKMKMPAQIDLDTKIVLSGAGKVKMKSKAFAYAALAAVLMLCIAVGAVVIHNKNGDDTVKIGSSPNMTLEKDDTIPGGELTSVNQAAEQHRKCILLENDEYIKLKANRKNITKQMADSFYERMDKIGARDRECIDYIAEHTANSELKQPLFVHGILFDDGYIDISFRVGGNISEESQKLLSEQNKYYLCDNKTGERVMLCVTEYKTVYEDFGVLGYSSGRGTKIDTSEFSKLRGELSLVVENAKDVKQKMNVLDSFKFFEKEFIGGSEREELLKKVESAGGRSAEAIKMEVSELHCAPHGINFRLNIFPSSDNNKEQMNKLIERMKGGGNVAVMGEGENGIPKITDKNGWHYTSTLTDCKVVTAYEGIIAVDCYIDLNKQPPQDTSFKLMLQTDSRKLTDSEIANGAWKGDTVASVDIVYNLNTPEKQFVNSKGEVIMLTDTYFTVPEGHSDAAELTLKYPDGRKKVIKGSDVVPTGLGSFISGEYIDGACVENNTAFTPTNSGGNAHVFPNYFAEIFDTSNYTLAVFAGEEYKLKQTASDSKNNDLSDALKISAGNINASAHGISFRLSVTPNGDKGKEVLRAHPKIDDPNGNGIYIAGTYDNDSMPIINDSDGNVYNTFAGVTRIISKSDEHLVLDYYLALKKTPPSKTNFDVYLKTQSPETTENDRRNGNVKYTILGKTTLTYEPELSEYEFVSDKIGRGFIFLSDIYFTLPTVSSDEYVTLKFSDGTEKKIGCKELCTCDFITEGSPFAQWSAETNSKENVHAYFFKERIDTSNVTSVIYAGEEYKPAKPN